MKFIEDINLTNKKILIRVDYNIPIEEGKIVNDFRIKKSFTTIKYCLDKNASIILMSHLGRPNGTKDLKLTLEPIACYLEEALGVDVIFSDDCISKNSISMSTNLKPK